MDSMSTELGGVARGPGEKLGQIFGPKNEDLGNSRFMAVAFDISRLERNNYRGRPPENSTVHPMVHWYSRDTVGSSPLENPIRLSKQKGYSTILRIAGEGGHRPSRDCQTDNLLTRLSNKIPSKSNRILCEPRTLVVVEDPLELR